VAAPADFNGEKLIVDDGAEFSERLVAAMETQDDDDNAGNDNQLNAEPRKRLILVKSMYISTMIKTARSKTELPLEEGEDSSPLVEWGCGISKRYLKRI
jgi:hypothetical protein